MKCLKRKGKLEIGYNDNCFCPECGFEERPHDHISDEQFELMMKETTARLTRIGARVEVPNE